MLRDNRLICGMLLSLLIVSPFRNAAAEGPSTGQLEFFETRIRPVLVDQCYECHNSAKIAEGGLAVDDRASLLKGGDTGKILVPGKTAESRLLAILRHEVDGVKMPQGKGKLPDRVIADFEKWIATGAVDPRDAPPSAEELTQATSWETVLAKRKQWWSFQPIRNVAPPDVPNNTWSDHPIDRFVLEKLREKGLEPNELAEPQTLVRRLFFALIGLPPTPEEVELWSAKLSQPKGYDELVDHLLERPQFGERWARHWMDWLRYAESHGSEGDPTIDGIWHYRDYLIRALNQDVPYDQLVREHVAGDLLDKPRINRALGINESKIGPAHWRMVFHGFAPTDALDEKVRFIDDEINTFSKAFLGLTVSCARCHDHKFDPISQQDYYALFGILGSCRPGRSVIDIAEKQNVNRDLLAELKPQIRNAVAEAWLDSAKGLKARLITDESLWKKSDNTKHLLNPWFLIRKEVASGVQFSDAWKKRVAQWTEDRQARDEFAKRTYAQRWNLAREADYAGWFHQGLGLPDTPASAGHFSIALGNDDAIAGIFPAGVYSNGLTAKYAARLSSDTFRLEKNADLWVRVIGEGGASVRYVVEDYPRDGTVFPVRRVTGEWKWEKLDLTYWNGDKMHIELAAGKDAPLMVNNEARSWFGIRDALIVPRGEAAPPAESLEFLDPLFQLAAVSPPQSFEDLGDHYAVAVTTALKAWNMGTATDAQASLLDACVKQELLPNRLGDLPTTKPLIAEYRRLEEEIPVPTRVPGLEETVGRDQALFERGNHKTPGAVVPRRFLEAIDATPYRAPQSGRRQLADDLLRKDNPLTSRVIVNRLWHHLVGRGLVLTPDNFGRLGQEPTHPELLDYLATRFQDRGWSIKEMVRFIVTSKTWQLSSRPSARSQQIDPDNQLLSHAFLRRLEAEAIRDSLLSVSGSLSPDLYGGPADGSSDRRSLYVRVQRNSLDPFLRAFDFPEPFSAIGRRDATNVPAQSLTLLNDPRVSELASRWAGRVLADQRQTDDNARIQRMFLTAFGRPIEPAESQRFTQYLVDVKALSTRLAMRLKDLNGQVEQRQVAIRGIIEPVRTRLIDQAKAKSDAGEQVVPQPIGRWEFETDLQDLIGGANGEARNGAHLEDGTLVVKTSGHVVTLPLKQTIKQKTLEAWVRLDDLDQRGGGVMTIQSPDGVVFDSIVFGEQHPRQWLAGSNNFARTQSFNGSEEREAADRPVHVAIVYHVDGRIIGYRNGQPYGKPYQSQGPNEFKAGQAVIGFGIRHLPAGGNRMLSGRILRAQLYDRALTADEIQATSQSSPYFVSESQVLAALSDVDRQKVLQDRNQIQDLEREIQSLGTVPDTSDEKALWTEVARAMFLFKEFIYIP